MEEIMKRWVNEVHIGALQYTFVPRANLGLKFFYRGLECPSTFQWEKPIFRTALDIVDEYPKGRMMHLRSEFYSYSLNEVFSLFRSLISTWEIICDCSKHFYSKHRSMWWHKVFSSTCELLETLFYLTWKMLSKCCSMI